MTVLSSRANPKIKAVRALLDRKARQETGLFIVEGIHHVGEAVASPHVQLDAIYYAPDYLKSDFAQGLVQEQPAQGVPCYPVSTDVFDSLASKENPQGILAVVRQRSLALEQFTPENLSWAVALVAPQDPGNVGTILRTVDAVGAGGLLLLDSSVDPYHPSSVRASMGTLFWYPLIQARFDEFLPWARRHGYRIYGTSSRGSTDYQQVERYQPPCVLLMGSERAGLTPDQIAACDHLLRLPLRGRASSLNLAVATGVLLYHMLEHLG